MDKLYEMGLTYVDKGVIVTLSIKSVDANKRLSKKVNEGYYT